MIKVKCLGNIVYSTDIKCLIGKLLKMFREYSIQYGHKVSHWKALEASIFWDQSFNCKEYKKI